MDCKAEVLCESGRGGTVTFGYGFLVIVPSEQDTLVLHIFNFKACENLLEVPDEV